MENTARLSHDGIVEEYLPSVILKTFKEKYADLFATINKSSILNQDFSNFQDLFWCMYNWNKSKVAYNYPEEILKSVGNIDDLRFEAKYFVEMPFHTFYFEGNKDWDIHGIIVNITEVFAENNAMVNRVFRVNAIVICEDDSLETLNLEEANISFLITEGDTYGSYYPYDDTDSYTIDYFERRNGELRFSILKMCYLLYKKSHERNFISNIGKTQKSDGIPNAEIEKWDMEHRIIFDDLDRKEIEKETIKGQIKKMEESSKEKKKRKSPRPHQRAGTEGFRWCGSGENRHLEKRWIKGSFPNCNKGNVEIPVVERRKKEKNMN